MTLCDALCAVGLALFSLFLLLESVSFPCNMITSRESIESL